MIALMKIVPRVFLIPRAALGALHSSSFARVLQNGLDQPQITAAAAVENVHFFRVGVQEDVEVVPQHLHLQRRLLRRHRAHREAFRPRDAGPGSALPDGFAARFAIRFVALVEQPRLVLLDLPLEPVAHQVNGLVEARAALLRLHEIVRQVQRDIDDLDLALGAQRDVRFEDPVVVPRETFELRFHVTAQGVSHALVPASDVDLHTRLGALKKKMMGAFVFRLVKMKSCPKRELVCRERRGRDDGEPEDYSGHDVRPLRTRLDDLTFHDGIWTGTGSLIWSSGRRRCSSESVTNSKPARRYACTIDGSASMVDADPLCSRMTAGDLAWSITFWRMKADVSLRQSPGSTSHNATISRWARAASIVCASKLPCGGRKYATSLPVTLLMDAAPSTTSACCAGNDSVLISGWLCVWLPISMPAAAALAASAGWSTASRPMKKKSAGTPRFANVRSSAGVTTG